jgi:DNA polymerase-3 subunit chi
MTEVLFYHLQNQAAESVLPPLLERSLERGWKVVVQTASEERADAIDAHLWTYSDDSFLPHGTWRCGRTADRHRGDGGQSERRERPVPDRLRSLAGEFGGL